MSSNVPASALHRMACRIAFQASASAILALNESKVTPEDGTPEGACLRMLSNVRDILSPLTRADCPGFGDDDSAAVFTIPQPANKERARKCCKEWREMDWADALEWARQRGLSPLPRNVTDWIRAVEAVERAAGLVAPDESRPVDVISAAERAELAELREDSIPVECQRISKPSTDSVPNDKVPMRRSVDDILRANAKANRRAQMTALQHEARERNKDGFTVPALVYYGPGVDLDSLADVMRRDDERRGLRAKGIVAQSAPVRDVKTTAANPPTPSPAPAVLRPAARTVGTV